MIIDETENGVRVDTFLAVDLIVPFEDRKIEETEEEKEMLIEELMQAMYDMDELPD